MNEKKISIDCGYQYPRYFQKTRVNKESQGPSSKPGKNNTSSNNAPNMNWDTTTEQDTSLNGPYINVMMHF